MNISAIGYRSNLAFGKGQTIRVMHAEDDKRIWQPCVEEVLRESVESEHEDTLDLVQCDTFDKANQTLTDNQKTPFNLVVVDGKISKYGDGLAIMKKARETHPPNKIIMLSSGLSLESDVTEQGSLFIDKGSTSEDLKKAFSDVIYQDKEKT